jgi:hypothetical protein
LRVDAHPDRQQYVDDSVITASEGNLCRETLVVEVNVGTFKGVVS